MRCSIGTFDRGRALCSGRFPMLDRAKPRFARRPHLRRTRSSNRSSSLTVAPICGFVRETLSAELDHEGASLNRAETEEHLARCAPCRQFEEAASSLGALLSGCPIPIVPCGADVFSDRLARRSHHFLMSFGATSTGHRRVRFAVGPLLIAVFVALGVLLPTLAFSHVTMAKAGIVGIRAHTLAHSPCSTLLLRYNFSR